jgi:hypothetical protein
LDGHVAYTGAVRSAYTVLIATLKEMRELERLVLLLKDNIKMEI